MPDPNFTILYVDSPTVSAAFYEGILGRAPIEQSPTFAMFALPSGTMLGIWKRDWTTRGLHVVQQPTDMDFGHTFVALDPDGHRLRVFHPTAS